MILSFSTTFPENVKDIGGEQTNFAEKIWVNLIEENLNRIHLHTEFENAFEDKFRGTNKYRLWNNGFGSDKFGRYKAKLHTIREDKTNRWKKGNSIQFYFFTRTKDMFKFRPDSKCVSIQEIEIIYEGDICEKNGMEPIIKIDGKIISISKAEQLAVTDGFRNLSDFCKYFSTDFKGKIIHWTTFKY